MSPALNSAAFLLLSFALGLGFKGALNFSGAVERWWDGHSDPAEEFMAVEPSALDRMLTWTGMGMLAAGFLDYFPSLHPGLASPPWAAYAGASGFLLLGCSQIAHKAAVQMEAENAIDWRALGLFALGVSVHLLQEIEVIFK